jgi:hypothetical protein
VNRRIRRAMSANREQVFDHYCSRHELREERWRKQRWTVSGRTWPAPAAFAGPPVRVCPVVDRGTRETVQGGEYSTLPEAILAAKALAFAKQASALVIIDRATFTLRTMLGRAESVPGLLVLAEIDPKDKLFT